jgi:hypothetical protein
MYSQHIIPNLVTSGETKLMDMDTIINYKVVDIKGVVTQEYILDSERLVTSIKVPGYSSGPYYVEWLTKINGIKREKMIICN